MIEIVAAKLRDPPCPEFRVVVVLPAKPNNGSDDTRGQLGVLVNAATDGGDPGRFLACTLFQPHGNPVYVHAKVGIVDDAWLTVGSANEQAQHRKLRLLRGASRRSKSSVGGPINGLLVDG